MSSNILSIFHLDNIRFYQNACLNFLNSQQVCQDCLNVCPLQAISLKDKLPVINFSKCKECGLCTAVCTTLALDNNRYPYSAIHNQLINNPLATITCEKDQLHTRGIKLPCLLAIDLPLLLTLNKHQSTLNLYIGDCSSCSTAPLSSIKSHFAELQNDLLAMNSEFKIRLTEENFTENPAEPVSGLTRRELLQSFSFKKFKEFEFINDTEEPLHEENKEHLKERVLYKREIVTEHLKSTKRINYTGKLANRYQVELTSACNGCDVCTAICPTNALHWQETEDTAFLCFDSELCIGCGKCTLCSESAIKIHTTNYNTIQDVNPIILTSFRLNRCQACNELFRSNKKNNFCPICDKQRNRESFFTNF